MQAVLADLIREGQAARYMILKRKKEGYMTYKRVLVTGKGGPERLEIVEENLRPPSQDEVRVRVLAAPVSLTDVEARYGRTPFQPRFPFTPGYAVIGVVDALGQDVQGASVGDHVAALTTYGGYAEYIYLERVELIQVPADVDPVQAAPLILNYIVAFQCMHRTAKVRRGDKVLVVGASGGIGTAFLQLGKLAGLEMYALASESKHQILAAYGASPIDYHTQDYLEVVREAVSEGLDAVFDGVGGDYIPGGFSLLRRGGMLATYANPINLPRTFVQFGQVMLLNLLPNGRSARYYSTGQSRLNPRPFREDWAALFELLLVGQIDPVISGVFPLDQAAQANALLESGTVIGNLVLSMHEGA